MPAEDWLKRADAHQAKLVARCKEKRHYSDKKSARMAAKFYRTQSKLRAHQYPYQCPVCGLWALTSRKNVFE